MAIIFDEKQSLEDNAFLFEERVKSPAARYIDKTYVLTDYWHIRNQETTVDGGWKNVEEILGERSPVRFQVIRDMPLYLNEPISINLSETDVGIDGSYEGQATVPPGTIIPLEDDHFIIKQLNDDYVFRVTEVRKDNTMSDGFHEITFILDYIDWEKKDELEKQTTKKTICLNENIGTNEKCIIEDSYYDELRKIDAMYAEMVENYTTFFYNSRYNCLLGDWKDGQKIYDPFQREFCQKHRLFQIKNHIDTLVLNDQFEDPRRKVKYEQSIYRFIEQKEISKLCRFPFMVFPGESNKQTAFARWYDHLVVIADIQATMPENASVLLSEEAVNIIRMNYPTDNKYLSFISNYLHRDDMTLSEVDLTLGEELLVLRDSNTEVFFFTPIILYIIREIEAKFLYRREKKSM